MDPVTFAALIGLGGKALEVGASVWKTWSERRGGGVAIAADGSRFELAHEGRYLGLGADITESGSFPAALPIRFEGAFVPADTWAETYLLADQPVLLVIANKDEGSPFNSMVALTMLGGGFEGSLFPGDYVLAAYVFLDEDFLDDDGGWSEEDLDGGGLVEFSVRPNEPPFRLEIGIEAVPQPEHVAAPVHVIGTGHLDEGEQERWAIDLEADVTYTFMVVPEDPTADFDLFLYDENDNLVDADEEVDAEAQCSVTPRWSGAFTIVVECAEGESAYSLSLHAA